MTDIYFTGAISNIVIRVAWTVLDRKSNALFCAIITKESGKLISRRRRNTATNQLSNSTYIFLRVTQAESLVVIIGHAKQNMTTVRVCKRGYRF